MKGHVYKRGKTFTYMFDGPPDPLTGKRKQVTKGGFTAEKEAWRECRAAMKRAEEGRHVTPARRTVGDFLRAEWLPAVKDSARATTWGNWQVLVNSYVVPVLGDVRLQSLTAPQIQMFYRHLLTVGRIKRDLDTVMFRYWQARQAEGTEPSPRQVVEACGVSIHAARSALRRYRAGHVPQGKESGLEPKTVRNVHIMLHKALADAVAWKYVEDNVAASVKPPAVPRRRRHNVWTPAQLRRFLTHARSDRFYALYLVAATTGMRRAELCGLTWRALDLAGGTLSVDETRVVVNGHAQGGDGKTDNAARYLGLDKATVAALREWRQVQDGERAFFGEDYRGSDLVFTWEDGRPIHPDVVRQRFNRMSAACGLPHIRLHDVRHSYATASLRAGVHPKVVSERLGHASVAFTLSVYTASVPSMDRDAADTVAAMFVDVPEGDGDPAEDSR